MAYSTQRGFFYVPYLNERAKYECSDACVKLKSYPSSFDDRSWSANENKKSKFVIDLVNCDTPVVPENASGERGPNRPDQTRKGGDNKRAGNQGQNPRRRGRRQDINSFSAQPYQGSKCNQQSPVRYARPDTSSKSGLGRRRSTVGVVWSPVQKSQGPSSRRSSGVLGSPTRKRVFTDPDEDSPRRGGRGRLDAPSKVSQYLDVQDESCAQFSHGDMKNVLIGDTYQEQTTFYPNESGEEWGSTYDWDGSRYDDGYDSTGQEAPCQAECWFNCQASSHDQQDSAGQNRQDRGRRQRREIPTQLQLDRQAAYERLCAYAAGRGDIYCGQKS